MRQYDGRNLDGFSLVKLSGLLHEDSMVGIPSQIHTQAIREVEIETDCKQCVPDDLQTRY